MSNTLNNDLREALANDAFTIKDPGANGTIPFRGNMAFGRVTLSSAGTNAISSAANVPLGAMLIVFAQATVTVNSVGLVDGEYAEFFVTLNSSGAHTWTLRSIAASANATQFADTVNAEFGDAADITMGWDGTDFDVLQATPNSSIKWGVSGAGIDQVWYGDTAAANMTWDQSADTLLFGDNAKIGIGGVAGGDIVIAWDGTDLDITQATANSSIKWGVDGAGIDHVFYGDTASNSMTWDQSANALVFTALATITGAGSTFGMFTPSALQEANPAAGAISVTTFATQLDTAGAEAFTLADGAQIGQLKFIHMTVDGGDATLTPANLADGTTIVFSNIGDAVLLRWEGTEWRVILRMNFATAAITTPVIGA